MSIMPASTANVSGQHIFVGSVDDEPKHVEEVRKKLPATQTVERHDFHSVEEFKRSDIGRFHVLVVDAYFDRVSRLDELLEHVDLRWPDARVIILSAYPQPQIANNNEKVTRFIAKTDFFDGKVDLRDAVVDALRVVPGVDPNVVAQVAKELNEASTSTVSEIHLERIYYPLIQPAGVLYHNNEYTLEPFQGIVRGVGADEECAAADFARKFDELFDDLWRTPVDWRTDEEQGLWKLISQVVDVEEYERRQMIAVHDELGQVASVESDLTRVLQWHGGEHHGEKDPVKSEHLPRELRRLKPGSWFIACVHRDFRTRKLVKIVDGTAGKPPFLDEEARHEMWHAGQPSNKEKPK